MLSSLIATPQDVQMVEKNHRGEGDDQLDDDVSRADCISATHAIEVEFFGELGRRARSGALLCWFNRTAARDLPALP